MKDVSVLTMDDLEQQYYNALERVLKEAKEHNVSYVFTRTLSDFTVPQIRHFEYRLMTDLQMRWLGAYQSSGNDRFIDLYQHTVSKEFVVVSWGDSVSFAAQTIDSGSDIAIGIEKIYRDCRNWNVI